MKKITKYIFIPFIISISIGITTAYADFFSGFEGIGETLSEAGGTIADIAGFGNDPETYIPTVIPKPDLLPGPYPSEMAENKSHKKSLTSTILPRIGVGIIGFVAVGALIFLIAGGVRMTLTFGDEDSINKGKDQVIYAIVGFIIALFAYTIVAIIINLDFVEQREPTLGEYADFAESVGGDILDLFGTSD